MAVAKASRSSVNNRYCYAWLYLVKIKALAFESHQHEYLYVEHAVSNTSSRMMTRLGDKAPPLCINQHFNHLSGFW